MRVDDITMMGDNHVKEKKGKLLFVCSSCLHILFRRLPLESEMFGESIDLNVRNLQTSCKHSSRQITFFYFHS